METGVQIKCDQTYSVLKKQVCSCREKAHLFL